MSARVFIGSSSEAKPIAMQLQALLNAEEDITADGWWHAFPLSSIVVDELIKVADKYDYAVFLFAPDDITATRGELVKTARDNVVFEAGIFMKACGREKTIILVPELTDGSRAHILSDLSGFTYQSFKTPRDDGDWNAKLSTACLAIRNRIKDAVHLQDPHSLAFVGKWEGVINQMRGNPETLTSLSTTADFRAKGGRVGADLVITGELYRDTTQLQLWLDGQLLADSILRCNYGYLNLLGSEQAGSMVLKINGMRTEIKGKFVGYGPVSEKIVSGDVDLKKVSATSAVATPPA
jgi:hypothetical protein